MHLPIKLAELTKLEQGVDCMDDKVVTDLVGGNVYVAFARDMSLKRCLNYLLLGHLVWRSVIGQDRILQKIVFR